MRTKQVQNRIRRHLLPAALAVLLLSACAAPAESPGTEGTLTYIGGIPLSETVEASELTETGAIAEGTSTAETVTSVQTLPEDTASETTEASLTPSETQSAETTLAETKPGLWAEVATDKADWATRAVSDIVYTNADFGWQTVTSLYDADQDGMEDQADILQGAKDYVATRPVYDTSYFAGGWPPEGKGVCTDVAAYALLAAGYDLKELLSADIAAHPEDYPAGAGDANIDFRRTRNLLPFFQKYAESLTTDPYDYEAWQPGDIVIFGNPEHGMYPGHIAIVSDRRASDGLPYLIHHTDNNQYSYEEDYLTTPQRYIAGHFRVSGLQTGAALWTANESSGETDS